MLQTLGHRLAPTELAAQFAVESVWCEAPCGLHKAYNYLSPHALDAILARIEATYVTLAAAAGLEEAADRPQVQVPVD